MCRQGSVVVLSGLGGHAIGKMRFFVYGMKTVVNIMSAEMQLVGSIGAEIEIGSYAEVVNAVPGLTFL